MSLISSPLAVAPRVRLAPPAARNDAQLVVELCGAYGTTFDPWQLDMLDAGCGVREDGLWSAQTVGCNVARQNGKSVVLVARALTGALVFKEKVIILSAHEQKTSRVLFMNLLSYFENYADLSRRVRTISRALGREEIRLRGRTGDDIHIFFPARTRTTLRGWSVDCYLADEAQLLTNEQWESAKPTMSARPNAQTWLFGTAPQLITDAEVFGRLRRAAHGGTDDDSSNGKSFQPKRRGPLAWVEYGADPGADLDDRDQWAAANPGRVESSAIEAERRELSPGGFARERLNLWPTDRVEAVFDMDQWTSLVSPGPPDGTPPSAIAVDASPDRALAIAGAWLLDNDCHHVELLASDYVSDPLNALQFVVERAGRRIPVVIDGASPAASMVPALSAQRCKVIVTTARDMGRACGGFVDDVAAGRLSHADQPQLTAAVVGARKRPVGDAGAFGWDRRDGSVFISPLVAATLARFGAAAGRRRTGNAVFV